MKKTNRTRLTLDKTTIAHLTGVELGNVHGGQKPVTISACIDDGCTGMCPTKWGCVTKTGACP